MPVKQPSVRDGGTPWSPDVSLVLVLTAQDLLALGKRVKIRAIREANQHQPVADAAANTIKENEP